MEFTPKVFEEARLLRVRRSWVYQLMTRHWSGAPPAKTSLNLRSRLSRSRGLRFPWSRRHGVTGILHVPSKFELPAIALASVGVFIAVPAMAQAPIIEPAPLEAQAGRTTTFDIPAPAARPGADDLRPAGRPADRRQRRRRRGQVQQRRRRRHDRRAGAAAPPCRHRRVLPLHLAQRRDGVRRPRQQQRRSARSGARAGEHAATAGGDRQSSCPSMPAATSRAAAASASSATATTWTRRSARRPTPRSTSSGTRARTLVDAVSRRSDDPAALRPQGAYDDRMQIRGFLLGTGDMSFNGLYGVDADLQRRSGGHRAHRGVPRAVGDAERHGAQRARSAAP